MPKYVDFLTIHVTHQPNPAFRCWRHLCWFYVCRCCVSPARMQAETPPVGVSPSAFVCSRARMPFFFFSTCRRMTALAVIKCVCMCVPVCRPSRPPSLPISICFVWVEGPSRARAGRMRRSAPRRRTMSCVRVLFYRWSPLFIVLYALAPAFMKINGTLNAPHACRKPPAIRQERRRTSSFSLARAVCVCMCVCIRGHLSRPPCFTYPHLYTATRRRAASVSMSDGRPHGRGR